MPHQLLVGMGLWASGGDNMQCSFFPT